MYGIIYLWQAHFFVFFVVFSFVVSKAYFLGMIVKGNIWPSGNFDSIFRSW